SSIIQYMYLFLTIPHPPKATLFPYTTLFRSIKANPKSQQPFDVKGYKIPGGSPSIPAVAQILAIAPAMLRDKTKGCYPAPEAIRSEEHTSELQSRENLVCRLLLEKKKKKKSI